MVPTGVVQASLLYEYMNSIMFAIGEEHCHSVQDFWVVVGVGRLHSSDAEYRHCLFFFLLILLLVTRIFRKIIIITRMFMYMEKLIWTTY